MSLHLSQLYMEGLSLDFSETSKLPWFYFLKGTGKFVPVTYPELYFPSYIHFPTPATQNTKSSGRREVTAQTYSLVNTILKEKKIIHIF